MFSLSDYSYDLPESLIAQIATHPHHDARLLIVDRESGKVNDESSFWHLDTYLGDDRVLFFNNSRVIPSRILLEQVPFVRADGVQSILEKGEIFFLKEIGYDQFEALVKPGHKFKIGSIFSLGEYTLSVTDTTDTGRILRVEGGGRGTLLSRYGRLPLPPYITYSEEKEKDYQTAFAEKDGSVAAPTASLHFTQELLEKLKHQKEYLTLHVGLGTFQPIKTGDVRDYAIHRESIEVLGDIFATIATTKSAGRKIVAVGTTACRTLESLPHLWKRLDTDAKKHLNAQVRNWWDTLTETLEIEDWIHDISLDAESGILNFETSIYITPGYRFQIVDDLITNFHLPESSLLVLVSAFLGYENTMRLYKTAIEKRYRFYSFGDGMYIRGK